MAYENEVRPAARDTHVERTTASSSYALPIIALLIVVGGGLWFFSTRDTGPAPAPTTIERTTTPSTPAPSPTIPSPTTPAPSTPTTPK